MKMELRQRQTMSTKMYVVAGATTVIGLTFALTVFLNLGDSRDTLAQKFNLAGEEAAAGDFRSIRSGEWNNAGTWETYNGSAWEAAEMYPSSTDGMINILSSHEVILTSDEIIDELNVSGKLTLNTHRIMLLDGNININGSLKVNGRLMCGNNLVEGKGSFTLADGATILIGSAEGICLDGQKGNIQTDSRSYSANANYVYCGTEPQLTGNGLPTGEINGTLTLDNEKGCSLTNSLALNGQLLLREGVLCLNGKTLTMHSEQLSRLGGSLNLCGGNVASAAPVKTAETVSISSLTAVNGLISDTNRK